MENQEKDTKINVENSKVEQNKDGDNKKKRKIRKILVTIVAAIAIFAIFVYARGEYLEIKEIGENYVVVTNKITYIVYL